MVINEEKPKQGRNEMTSETEELNALKERVAELEESRECIFEQLQALKRRLDQIDEAQMWKEEADNDRRPIYGYW